MNTLSQHNVLEGILEGLMRRYTERVPDVTKVLDALKQRGIIKTYSDIENDHVAFRTMGVENLGVASFEKIFLNCGYTKRDYFFFEGKKLDAWWYAPPIPAYPRIFISQLRVDDLSPATAELIRSYTDEVTHDPLRDIDLNDVSAVDRFLHTPLWRTPLLADYQKLLDVSEYAAWVIYNRYYLNHYTISVHNLPEGYNTLEEFNAFLESIGVKLNSAGGKIKVSPDGLLKQSSSVSELCRAEFAGGETAQIAGSYVEFAERLVMPEFAGLATQEITREHRRDGFEAGNADKIFESTYTSQIDR